MREIIFRGKRTDNGEWVYGYIGKSTYGMTIFSNLYHVDGGEWNIENEDTVLPDTVGQFTGLLDKNGKKIFEGDILRLPKGTLRTVIGVPGGFAIEELDFDCGKYGNDAIVPIAGLANEQNWGFIEQCGVIGNVTDNPELLQEKRP